ncbi:uncharacterized protein LOC108742690 [Agrilus planipennis]|uniref:Uncharacterized protein LOC108742690 n=1 Tax=Agrilus planipennis TaxID=224129 RepID=A0A1W4XM76_AGRPL|nr:uncharacterized protein LOC108742690 [Agrilus planipennis]
MKDLIKNKCRICVKVFCCENCREKHEVSFHNVNPVCEICLHGKVYSKKVTGRLLHHIKDKHLPLSCVFCKKLFENLTETEFHSKCLRITNNRLEMNPVTPINRQSPLKIQTPYQKSIIMASNAYFAVTNTTVHPTTSTPLQNMRSENNILEKISSDLTPLDNRERENANTSRITPVTTDEPKKMEELKRKVTFCDTPNVEYQKNRQGSFTKDLVKYLIVEEDCQCTASTEKCDHSLTIPKSETNENIFQNLDTDRNSKLSQNEKHTEQIHKTNDYDQKNDMKNYESLFKSCDEKFAESKSEQRLGEEDCSQRNVTASNNTEQFSRNSDEFRTPLSNPEPSETFKNNAHFQCKTPTLTCNNNHNSPSETSSTGISYTKENETSSKVAHEAQSKSNSENEFRTPLCEINCCLIVEKSCSGNNFNAVNIIKKTIDLQCTPKIKEIECNKCILDGTNLIETNINEISDEMRTRKPVAQSSIIQYCVQRTQKTEICETRFTTTAVSEDSSITANKTNSLWSSMTNLVKTVFHGFSSHGVTEIKKSNPLKRSYCEDGNINSEQEPYLKRMKLTDIRCRPTIRNLRPAYRMNSFTRFKETADKATQTDESFLLK